MSHCQSCTTRRLILTALVWSLAPAAARAAARPSEALPLPEVVQFNRDIRPILSDNCYACHGPDKNKREADLRLDTQAGLVGQDGAAAAVVAAKPDESPLWQRITSDDPEHRMPPAATGKQLSARDLELIRRWIEQGAAWQGHWSLNPIVQPPLPAAADHAALEDAANPIDRFVAAKRREGGLPAAPPADRRTLLRRLTFDLTGLPPTAAEVENFASDQRPDAYERLVDRLLASPRYGERMALWWLDLVRYADSVGYHGDQPVSVFPYRQYVIDAFNANRAFDQFTVEQLAGDLLPEPTREQRIASGYNRLGMMSAEGGVQDKEYLAKYIAERVRNVSGAWLGVTLGCCECHDHKYDPFTSRDFYRMQAFFADVQERGFYANAHATGEWGPRLPVPSPQQETQQAALAAEVSRLEAMVAADTPELAAAQSQWEAAQQSWLTLRPAEMTSAGGASLKLLDDGSILVSGEKPDKDTFTLVITAPPAGMTALRIDVLPDDTLPSKGPGRADNGNFALTEVHAELRITAAPTDATAEETQTATSVAWRRAHASFEQMEHGGQTDIGRWAASYTIDGDAKDPTWGWAVLEQVGKPNALVLETGGPAAPSGEGTSLVVTLSQNLGERHTLGRFRLSATASPFDPALSLAILPAEVAAALSASSEQRTPEQRTALQNYFRQWTPRLAGERQELAAARQQLDSVVKAIPTTLVTVAVEPRTVRVLPRGNWMDDGGEAVEPAVPGVLPQLTAVDRRPTRLDLARWLVDPHNPLTARTLANRLWKLMFGAGLSRRLDDLGAQGQWPTHPELLDWLAGELHRGWDVKRLLRLMALSQTYQQSSVADAAALERDPENVYLARQNRFRLDAELVRDNALAVGGLLVERLGGPSVFPYQPPGYWSHLNFPIREWENGQGAALYRRGLYTHWQRQYLHPALLAFDAPNREECAADRPRSNTPLQSLVLLNDPSYVEAARALAQRTLREAPGSSDASDAVAARVDWALRQALGRPGRREELDILAALYRRQAEQFRADPAAAQELLQVGSWPADATLDPAELAAWTGVARAILNLHETVTRN